jgi:HNH endonuclease
MDAARREQVRLRAKDRCEYCRLSQVHAPVPQFHVEHIRPRKHGGTDAYENLCLACNHCNLHKASNLTGIDPLRGSVTRLFDPRKDRWSDHFYFHAARIVGRTDVGRTTVRVLAMNDSERLELRRQLLEFGRLD